MIAFRRGLVAVAAALLLPAAALAASDGDDALRLAARLAAPIGHADVLLHAVPKDFPSAVPLPSASLLGSVVQHFPNTGSYGPGAFLVQNANPVALYYDVTGDRAAVVTAYEARLGAAGWKAGDLSRNMPFPQGGFAMQLPATKVWCSPSTPQSVITLGTPAEDPRALNVSLTSMAMGAAMFCGSGGASFPFNMLPKSPLPTFTAPPGIVISGAGPVTQGWTSGAHLETSLALPAVFEGFAKQLRDAGWTAGESTAASGLRSQTFRKTADGKSYVALLTVYALDATHDVALADVTPAGS